MRWSVLLLFFLTPVHAATYYVNLQVKDSTGLYLPKVGLEEIRLFADGVERKPAYLFGRDLPMAIAVFYDIGPKMTPDEFNLNPLYQSRLQRARAVTLEILDRLKTDYSMALYSYLQEAVRLLDFTNDAQSLENALRKLQPAVRRAEVNQADSLVSAALEQGIEALKNRDEKRKFLVLFTYVMDAGTSRALEAVGRRLARYNIDLYVISFGPRSTSGAGFSMEERMNVFWFKKLVDAGSGEFYLTDLYREDARELAFEIADRWNATLTLAFETAEDVSGKPLRIELARPHAKVFTRSRVPYK